ncbi:MAG: hypothetical protein L0196_06675 [candidate division Zixibacteria bacterium]|nr:hypothetical protein [candidate division Zixibacteria bacterium]
MKISPRLVMLLAFMAKSKLEGRIQLKYDVLPNEIDADILLRSLSGIIQAIGEISAETTKSRVDVKVTALKGGTFNVFLLLTPETLSTLISTLGPPSIPTILRCLIEYLKLKNLLKGEKPIEVIKKQTGIEVKNNEGTIIELRDNSTLNLYLHNTKLSNNIEETFGVLQTDPAICTAPPNFGQAFS